MSTIAFKCLDFRLAENENNYHKETRSFYNIGFGALKYPCSRLSKK